MNNLTTLKITTLGEKLYHALRSPDVKIILLPGGTRSGKTYAIMQNIHLYMAEHPRTRATAWRSRQTWVRLSILNDWEREFLGKSALSHQYKSVKTPPLYTLTQTQSTLEFSGLDDPQKVHGVASDLIWINEAVETELETFRQLLQRCKGKIIMDYNPSEENHWVYELEKRPDCVVIHSTYKDNPFLPDTTVREIEAYEDTPFNRANGTVSDYHWQVYGLGLPSKKEGLIYTYNILKEYPQEANDWGYGLDFGFYPDPAAFARVGFYDGKVIIDELFYEYGLNNVRINDKPEYPSIQEHFEKLNIKRKDKIIADSAAKTSINELKTAGYNIHPVQKYAGSVDDGIKLLQQYSPLYITETSVNLKRELDNYTWIKDPLTGRYQNKPIDKYNHLLDLIRYVVQTKISNKTQSRGIRKIIYK